MAQNNDPAAAFTKFARIQQTFAQAERINTAPTKRWKESLAIFFNNRGALAGVIIIGLLILGVIIFPLIFTNTDSIPQNANLPFFSHDHFLGTDKNGRDMWSALWIGLRYSIGIALMVTAIDLVVGVFLGLIMGYSVIADRILQFIIKILMTIPNLLLLILLGLVLNPSYWSIVLGLGIVGWINMSMQVRAQVLRIKHLEFFVASRILSTPWYKKLWNILPLSLPVITTNLVLTIPAAILGEAALAFLGLSIPNQATLGSMIFVVQDVITIYPREILVPVVFLIFVTVSIQLIGNGIQDVVKRGL